MDENRQRRKELTPAVAARTEQVLESYYSQLLEWGTLLTRGDVGKAHDLVHDLWLHLTLTKPDLSGITNLDGYLYTCLRHIYLSSLVASSRDALQLVSIADFDSIQFALAPNRPNDLVQRQNDLRKACSYAVWRKAHSKGASHFVLRFFHGYQHQEIADLAGLPISAIYNKLRTARAEVRSYLEEPGKLQFTNRDLPPAPALLWTPLPSIDLFKELRKTILDARVGACLPESELIARYRSDLSNPISCSLLAHIVSCERCLEVMDQHLRRPTLKDREPLDDFGSSSAKTGNGKTPSAGTKRDRLLRSVEKHRSEVLEHRPRTLSIAVDGKILASHNVQGESNTLSARIERPDQASFVEVFSEQGIRLALISIASLPPRGPHEQCQRTVMNDGRWLELRLSFDGLGLNSEVTYFDPALMAEIAEEETSDEPVRVLADSLSYRTGKLRSWGSPSAVLASLRRFLRPHRAPSTTFSPRVVSKMNPIPVSVLVVLLASVMLFFIWERRAPAVSASELLRQAEIWDRHPSPATQNGVVFQKVRIHTRKTTTERTLYRDATGHRKPKPDAPRASDAEINQLLERAGIDWQQPLSVARFREWHDHLAEKADEVKDADPTLLTLVTDTDSTIVKESSLSVRKMDFHPVARRVLMRDSEEIEISEMNYDVLSWDAINAVSLFEPEPTAVGAKPAVPQPMGNSFEAELAVRYALHGVGADLGEPLDIQKGIEGPASLSVIGIVASAERKQELLAALKGIPHVAVQLQTEQEAAKAQPRLPSRVRRAEPLIVAAHSPLEKELLEYLGNPQAVENFSKSAIAITERLMAHASALHQLSERFAVRGSGGEVASNPALSPSARQLLQVISRDHHRAMSDATSELTALLGPVLQSMGEAPRESVPRLSLFASAQQVQRLTLELLSGSGSQNANETSEPAKAAQDLNAALRGLETILEEQP